MVRGMSQPTDKPVTFLVVEDDTTTRELTSRLIRKMGHTVFEAVDGASGLEAVRRERPDIVLLDVVMPDQDGFSVCCRIKNDPELSDTFVIMVSSLRTSYQDRSGGLETGADAYLTRPIANRELQAQLKAFIRLKTVEKQLQQSLREKETLLREIHHRVKNNLAVVSGLLRLQMRRVDDDGVKSILADAQQRILTMAMVHEHLYQSNSFAEINIHHFLVRLVRTLKQSFGDTTGKIEIVCEVEDRSVDIVQAVPIGLLVNELVSNALKYAFRDRTDGRLFIGWSLDDQGRRQLIVRDNGVGMPEPPDWSGKNSLGLHLVKILAEEQLEGSIQLDLREGTCLTITY
jgi:two-component sensor histidine kinase